MRAASVRIGLVVLDHQFERAAQIPAHGIDFVDGHLHAVEHGQAEIGRWPGERADDADADRHRLLCACLGGQSQSHQQKNESAI
ncbi:hypothetical protein FQZ97_973930 [compost metagenome]